MYTLKTIQLTFILSTLFLILYALEPNPMEGQNPRSQVSATNNEISLASPSWGFELRRK